MFSFLYSLKDDDNSHIRAGVSPLVCFIRGAIMTLQSQHQENIQTNNYFPPNGSVHTWLWRLSQVPQWMKGCIYITVITDITTLIRIEYLIWCLGQLTKLLKNQYQPCSCSVKYAAGTIMEPGSGGRHGGGGSWGSGVTGKRGLVR